MDKMHSDSEDSWSSKIFRFLKKQCLLSICSIFLLTVGSLLWFDSKIDPIPFDLPEAPELIGVLSVNTKLQNAKVIHLGKVKGCESLVYINGMIYASCLNGAIIRFNDTDVETVVKVGPADCKKLPDCGRPLGMRHDRDNDRILFVDAYTGLYALDLATDHLKHLFPTLGQNFKVTFFNDLELMSNGDVIVTESSTKYQLHNLISLIFEGRGNGRLLRINPRSGDYHVVADNLYFPNGVQRHHKNPNIVLVVETIKMRILGIDVSAEAPSANRISVFADKLPGCPDNIRSAWNTNGYWVNFANIRHSQNTFTINLVAQIPALRTVLKKFFMDPVLHLLVTGKHGIVLRLDEVGNVAESLHDPDGLNVTSSSETLAMPDGKTLYLGSYFLPYLIKVHM